MNDTSADTTSFSDGDYRMHADLRFAIRRFQYFTEVQARAAGITSQQYLLLLIVRSHQSYPAVTIADTAKALQLRPHAASSLADRCVRAGLLHRQDDPQDRRRVQLSLTPKGQAFLDTIMRASQQEPVLFLSRAITQISSMDR